MDALRHGWPLAFEGGPVLLPVETAIAQGAKAERMLISAARAATLKLANQREAAVPHAPVLIAGAEDFTLRDALPISANDAELLSLEPIQRLVAILRQLPGFDPQLLLKRVPRLLQETELRRMGAELARGLAERGVVHLVRDVLVGADLQRKPA